ncbi:MAG: MFS transporter [Paracoccaceae bacterium]
MSFATWAALLNNFVIEKGKFAGIEIGWLHSVREVPGLLAVGVIAILMVIREQVLAVVMLALLGVATALTAHFPSFSGILVLTMLSSIAFHFFETVNQSLQLQWIDKARAPKILGYLSAVGSGAALVAYGLIMLTWDRLKLSYEIVYGISGGLTILIALYCAFVFSQFESSNRQNRSLVLRKRYWLYYLLQFFSGARRQIFFVFAAFMMVERFGFSVQEVTALFLINYVANIALAPFMGQFIARFGERIALITEYAGLSMVFLAYGGLFWFGWGVFVAGTLYVVDHMFFGFSFALNTYFQKIADPADIAPSAAVAFSINHISAVLLPAALGYLWVLRPDAVFIAAAVLALTSLLLVLLIPRHPSAGHETILSPPTLSPV